MSMDVTGLWQSILSVIGMLLLTIFGVTQYLNHTGFCYAEKRYLSERELVDRYLFGEKADAMSFEEKVEAAKHRSYPTGVGEIEYPACCKIDGEPFMLDELSRFANKTFIGKYLFEFEGYIPIKRSNSTTRHPYEYIISAVDSCGGVTGADSTSIDVSKSSYENALERNRKYWKEMESKK